MKDISSLRVERYSGEELTRYIEDVARLRIKVFREFPYLYDGSMAYEENYLQTYIRCAQAVVVVVFDGDKVVGASTGIPMADEEEGFQKPFVDNGFDPQSIFYCAESVLEPEYRGKGLGVRFFQEREAHALTVGNFDYFVFCSVIRPQDHPLRPPGYRPLDRFWINRGYQRQPQLVASYSWIDVDQNKETSKALEFWVKSAIQGPADGP